jgi:hypothetical protein
VTSNERSTFCLLITQYVAASDTECLSAMTLASMDAPVDDSLEAHIAFVPHVQNLDFLIHHLFDTLHGHDKSALQDCSFAWHAECYHKPAVMRGSLPAQPCS